MTDLVLEAPIRRTLAVLLVAVEREDACMARLVGILADLWDIAVLILDVAVLIADARVEIVALAALDGVVEAERSNARMTECIEAFIVIAELVRQDVVARRELHAVTDNRDRVVGTPVEELVARRRDADGQMVALVREVQEVVVKAVLIVARRAVAVIVDGEQTLFAVVRVEVERHMDRARVLARRQDGLGIGTSEVGEQPDGALEVGARQVVTLFEEGRLALDDAFMDLRVVLDRDAVKAADRHGVFDDTVLNLLHWQIGMCGNVAPVAEVARECIGAVLQVLEGHELALLVGEQALEGFLAVDILARNLEVIDLYFQGIRQVEARALLLLDLDVSTTERDTALTKVFLVLLLFRQLTSVDQSVAVRFNLSAVRQCRRR